MRSVTSTAGLALAGAVALGACSAPAWGDCSCLCVDGTYQAVCSAPEDVQANAGMCAAQAQQSCPDDPEGVEAEAFDAPLEGTQNCRNARIYDAGAGDFVTAKVCDVMPAAAADG